MNSYLNDSIFWIEVEKIVSNPYQPRKEFNQDALNDLADSIRQYGILQPLVVTRKEEEKEDGGLRVYYELVAGERRLRASKIAGISQVPTVIRSVPEDPKEKLEIAIIENLQREDLNPIDRARAFARLVEEFGFKHSQVAKKVGRSREYVSNSLRLLDLPEEVQEGIKKRDVTEGHARTLGMLKEHPDEQKVLYKEIVYKKLSVREAEKIARSVAKDRVRKKEHIPDPELTELEGKLSNTLGTRVHIERKENGGKLVIDFFSNNDLEDILTLMDSNKTQGANAFMDRFIKTQKVAEATPEEVSDAQQGGVSEAPDEEVVESVSDMTHTGQEKNKVDSEDPSREELAPQREPIGESSLVTASEQGESDVLPNIPPNETPVEVESAYGAASPDTPSHQSQEVEEVLPEERDENTELQDESSQTEENLHEASETHDAHTEIFHQQITSTGEKFQPGHEMSKNEDVNIDVEHRDESRFSEQTDESRAEEVTHEEDEASSEAAQGVDSMQAGGGAAQEDHVEERWEPKPSEENTDEGLYSVKNFTI